MKILIAPDKFRGSLEADEVCQAAEKGILRAFPQAEVTCIPLADGGEGTAAILTHYAGGVSVSTQVNDPLGRPIEASYGLSADGTTAFIEMAAASGLALLSKMERNPERTSTFGSGQLIRDALDRGARKLVLGIGGSATTDAGIGMAAALGFLFKDQNGRPVSPAGHALSSIAFIDSSQADPRLAETSVTVACDVTNPLFGSTGAAVIYGPQKGADPAMVQRLDAGLKHFAGIAESHFGKKASSLPGAGAAGGLGAGAIWFLNATLRDGVSIVMEYSRIFELIRQSDLVITGEGKVDNQTLSGKVVKGLADACTSAGVPLAVICGTLHIKPEAAAAAGMTFVTSVLDRPVTLEQAQQNAPRLVSDATFHLARLFFYNR
ncbi:glycerate kinase [Dyadobacter sandarakinus]|uniref:Glycerate kinase n=1 Tax=Dyadobacter sandarakinus TaxID=2747268 RepID=A0ABX7I7N7_9BACT|nr:glycerate kinase [Dyadobacter sandarakinus]QRR01738.1 glycerate kinase [Dyadobacter sandarakinus]